MSRPRKPRNCADAHYLARVWKGRALSMRKRAERWIEAHRIPVGEAAIRAYVNDDCLEEIIDRETAGTWSTTIWNGQGSGAYGLPQALPGHKMASAGPDWRTSAVTQIRWMRGYVNSRYGGSCSALAHHNANGWY